MAQSSSNKQIGYILRSYPRLSQTFILNEILALEQLGLNLQIFPITNPREPTIQPQAFDVRAPVRYLDLERNRKGTSFLTEHFYWMKFSPRRYVSTLWYTVRGKAIDSGYTASSRFECFMQAVYLARLILDDAQSIGGRIGHIHAHFAHDPTLIAFLVHMLTGISYSFTTHARDLYQVPVSELVQRVEQATSIVTCCYANVLYLNEVLPDSLQAKVSLIHHGVDLQGFRVPAAYNESKTPLILSIGRLVEKKGFFDLLQACLLLKQWGVRFRCEIYGDGPLRTELEAYIQLHGLTKQVTLTGTRTQKQLVPIYQQASIFVLTPSITEDQDRDGIPNVLVEAMACGLPVISTAVGGIPELVHHNENGLLFTPHDVQSISAGLADLLGDEPKRKNLGAEARRSVLGGYDARLAANQLAALFLNSLQTQSILNRI